jgi:ubiquinone/menaquinone biosynthesis C-methylase UbiE
VNETPDYSYTAERDYYSRNWPQVARAYGSEEDYIRCWLDADAVFGGRRILDVGAGESTYTRMIADRFRPRAIVACDLFAERMRPARSVNGNPALRFVAGDCFRLPFRGEAFDVVFGSLVLHQLGRLAPIAQEIDRVLTPRGLYVGIEPNPFHPIHLWRYWRGSHSANQYLLRPAHLKTFEALGFTVAIRYFFARWPVLRGPLFGTCMGIVARKRAE